jgi:DNA-directed RNA polymerase sigma subunit (sigma70/sigma32)
MSEIFIPNQKAIESILDTDERLVIYLYFGFLPKKPMSLAQIAKFTGKGKETVRRIKIRAIDKLKENPEVLELFKDYI